MKEIIDTLSELFVSLFAVAVIFAALVTLILLAREVP